MNIYLAGKIAYRDWRHDLVSELADVDLMEDGFGQGKVWPVLQNAILGIHSYAGPYFIGGGQHGMYHGDANSHGYGIGVWNEPFDVVERRQGWVALQCVWAIDRSDMVFAYVESESAYGTLAEIGFAVAKGKPVYICGPRPLPDHWFVRSMPGVTVSSGHRWGCNVSAFLTDAIQQLGTPETNPQLTRQGSKFVYLLRCGEMYKIGVTRSIGDRVKQLQTANPQAIDVVDYVEATRFMELEASLHGAYRDARQSGEWFSLTPEQVRDAQQRMKVWPALPYGATPYYAEPRPSLRDRVRGLPAVTR